MCDIHVRITGTVISESAICRFLQRNNFSHKRLMNVAEQRNELLKQSFMAACEMYDAN